MADYTVELEGLDELERAFRKSPRLFDEEMNRAMRQALDLTEEQIAGRTPVNIGQLRGSIATEIRGKAMDMRGLVGTPLIYGLPVETGRRPKKSPPPIDAIEYWVIRKGIAPAGESRSVAFLIARAIGAWGTKGAFMFKEGLAAAEPRIADIFEGVPGRVLDRLD